jgi:multiple sugar transport system permease protein
MNMLRRVNTAQVRPYLLVAPAVVILLITVMYPIGFNFYAAFQNWNLLQSDAPQSFAGLSVMAEILEDPIFWNALRVTALFTVFAVCLEFVLGVCMALAVNEGVFAGRLLRTLLIAPIMATPLVVALVFKLIWHSEFGVANFALGLFGLPHVPWLAQPVSAFIAVLAVEVWHNSSFVFLVVLGAMQMLPRSPFEAAKVEGANWLQRTFYITLPMLKPAILVALLFRTVFAIRIFDEIYVLTRGGPNGATENISIMLYSAAFERFEVSHAAALSVFLLIGTAALAWILIRLMYRRAT